jgi:hypothetical protein
MSFTISGTTGIDLSTQPLTNKLPDANAPSGSVLQVVQATNNVRTATTSSALVNTYLTASITPTSASNKIVVLGQTALYSPNTQSGMVGFGIKRNSTVVYVPAADSGTPNKYYSFYMNTAASGIIIVPFFYMDSPATTSSTSYTIAINSYNGSSSVEDCPGGSGLMHTGTIILMEIAG